MERVRLRGRWLSELELISVFCLGLFDEVLLLGLEGGVGGLD